MEPESKKLFIPEINVETIKTRICEEMERRRYTTAPFDSAQAIPEFNASVLRDMIAAASFQADAGAEVTPMLQIPAPFRKLALFVGKVVIFLSSFIMVKQRNFNAINLHVLRVMVDSVERAIRGVIAGHQQEMAGLRQEMAAQHEVIVNGLLKHIAGLKTSIALQERRTAGLLEGLGGRKSSSLNNEQIQSANNEKKHLLDAMYLAFEDQFRGSRDLIKERVREHLPLMRAAGAGAQDRPILDVGCGRGEWLEILQEEGLLGEGIDLNRVMVEQCQQRGLKVTENDVISCLRTMPDASLGAVTGLHIIEHLPFEVLIELFDETLRVLKPGGVALFETPNPQNLVVGSWYFYMDPTHRNPLPSPTVKFLAESRGFNRVEIMNLHLPVELPRIDEATEVAQRFNEYFSGPMDYAVIAWRV